MKNVMTLVVMLGLAMQLTSQEQKVNTESVTLENLITHIVENYDVIEDEVDSEEAPKHLTFIIEAYGNLFNAEDKTLLKQAFKILAKRTSDADKLSLVAYSKSNGVLLNRTGCKDLKKILNVIEYPNKHLKNSEADGISEGYSIAKDNYSPEGENTVIMVRLPNRKAEVVAQAEQLNPSKNKGNGSAVVLTALTLLPEIIAVIKN
ncbi:hypothetical protein Q2T40_12005 [Winogradskyella maritima]|uniref:VWFA domain-containing protein n=1 Tax=Winogradskyella maritima TaxID=1517766 RepID=A0ABV8AJE2_9FLAO|nr:hypothetical protein [Winogradskyella maritima]